MKKTILIVEGGATGPNSKELDVRCREGFHKLLKEQGFAGRMPRIVPMGGRGQAFEGFKNAQRSSANGYVGLLVDSEDPVENLEATWQHLKKRDQWDCPPSAENDQVLFMTTCMETWIVADRDTLRSHYGSNLQENALPNLTDLESQGRHSVQDKLVRATRNCSNAYAKGKKSFEILGKLRPATLAKHLPSFARVIRILKAKL